MLLFLSSKLGQFAFSLEEMVFVMKVCMRGIRKVGFKGVLFCMKLPFCKKPIIIINGS